MSPVKKNKAIKEQDMGEIVVILNNFLPKYKGDITARI
jgi:hypothetical protein